MGAEKGEMFARVPDKVYDRLQKSRVGIAGAGGLGSNIAVMLARTGISSLVLVDFDKVEESNLNRQQYTLDQIGLDKVEALATNLKKINPGITLTLSREKITEENCHILFKDCQIVCEALDAADQKAGLINGILTKCPGTKIISGSGMAGYGDANEIRTVKKMSRLYLCGDEKSDFEKVEGMLAPRVTLCAAHQANQVIRLLMEEA
ncbi:MAG: sulfur carrier protein ThiS adenylyltransferase ThiF [Lachnospiraceae bacterium]|nr:sulfur carrier protein ThiS adenylyltransferase ThiF [Lachnospiraceae bacterium]